MNGRFLPSLPYRLGDNSPPIGFADLPHTPVQILRPQPNFPTSTLQQNNNMNNFMPNLLQSSPLISPLRIRVSTPTRLNADLLTVSTTASSMSPTIQLPNHSTSPGSLNNNNFRLTTSTTGSGNGHTILHRPFSPSPIPKDHS